MFAFPIAAAGPAFDASAAQRFADLALGCVHKEYPNKIAHVMSSDKDVQPPRELTPAFYGCFDWHSAVHGHWMLVRAARTWPDAPFAKPAREALAKSLTKEKVAKETAYLETEGRASFERPYGLAWMLQLSAELHEWDDPLARELSANLAPLEKAAVARVSAWLPKLSHPVRSGEHSQSAFALGLMLDYARVVKNAELETLVVGRILAYYGSDLDCPLAYEPSGEDFLSPCIAEADAMRRALSPVEYAAWLGAFMPRLPRDGSAAWIHPGVVTDRSDGKLVHLDGLNLSRAWMLEGIASGLPEGDPRRASILASSKEHEERGIAAITGQAYEGGHWLGSFATYLVTKRGLR
ncbi:MAG: DUF2891 domain-containing protein [Acidobacteria bacterium]|nr:DUF2891 domain-containing protein [Acidobacteriota bacterium]